jgi:hypothetical protein
MLTGLFIEQNVNTLEHTIGNTPLVKLQRMGPDNGSEIWVKLEGNNPGVGERQGGPVDDCRGRKARRD